MSNKMSVKEFLERYGERVKLRNTSTFYRHIYAHENELLKKGIIEFQENFTKRVLYILEPEQLAEFFEAIRTKLIEEKRKNYLKRKDRRKKEEEEPSHAIL